MAPKAATKSEGASKAKSSSSGHASYQDMIKEAIVSLKNRNGSSRQALKKYVKANNAHLKDVQDSMFDSLFNRALKNGVDKGVFEQPKGPSGGTKLAKPAAAAAKKDATKKEAVPKKEGEDKKPAAKKATTAKKPAAKKAAPKKEAAKKEDTKKAAPKKAAPKKAAPKKAAAPKEKKADAVVDKPAVLTKTKSGRVAKSTAPKPAAKKAAPKKAAAKKATPKKSEAASA